LLLSTRPLLTHSIFIVAFSFGTTLIDENRASAGVVINVFMAILIGSISLAMLAPEMQGESLEKSTEPYR
jgi:ATP-binding cassette subfamily B (MDR/TAP) protein 1